jgi:hypothetical protein
VVFPIVLLFFHCSLLIFHCCFTGIAGEGPQGQEEAAAECFTGPDLPPVQ